MWDGLGPDKMRDNKIVVEELTELANLYRQQN